MKNTLESIWEHPCTGWIMAIAGFAAAIRFILHSPTPGIAVTVLGGVAAIMSIRQLFPWEKFAWTLMIFALLYAEIHAINIDRKEQNRHQLEDRAAQDTNFQAIRTQQNLDFDATATGLTDAVGGLKANLAVATRTFQQTQPHAVLHFLQTTLLNPAAQWKANTTYSFNEAYINDGNEDGVILSQLAEIYVGKPDDKETELQLSKKFERDWKKDASVQPLKVEPHVPMYFSNYRSFSDEDLDDLRRGMTLYLFRRFKYSDSTGIWLSDDCADFQVDSHFDSVSRTNVHILKLAIMHSCALFNQGRYRFKQR